MNSRTMRLAGLEARIGNRNRRIEVIIGGGLPGAGEGNHAMLLPARIRVVRKRSEDTEGFRLRVRQMATEAKAESIVFGGLPN